MALEIQTDSSDEYSVRTFESGDREGILTLFETEWGTRPSTEWFDWKYVDDPYLSHVPITLAERDDQIVAVQGYVPCRLRRGADVVLALKPVDAVVHPDHRRQGLYSRITELGISRYEDRESACFFNFPNGASLGAQEKLGWSEVTIVSTYNRVQRPGSELPDEIASGPIEQVTNAVSRGGLELCDRLAPFGGTYDIKRYASPPPDLLESIYESQVPGAFHAYREAQYYRWLLDEPSLDHTAYVATRDDRPVAALVTRSDGGDVIIYDSLPLGASHDAFGDLLAAVVSDNEDADVLSVTDQTLSPSLLARHGFVSDGMPVVSRFSQPTYMAVRPLWDDDESAPFSRRELVDADNWCPSFLEVKD